MANRKSSPLFSCVSLDFTEALRQEDRLLEELRSQLRRGLTKLGLKDHDLIRSVYVIRMVGRFLIAYRDGNSPVLYSGRGNSSQRLASHLKNWLSEVHSFGKDVSIEIRICCPPRRNRPDFFKNVEADLIARFARKYGSVPFFNRRNETEHSGEVSYETDVIAEFKKVISVGSGNRPRWAIKPTRANPSFLTFLKGEHPE
jgi:hypothetical protein